MSIEELAALVRRIGGEGDRFLVVQRIPDLPDVSSRSGTRPVVTTSWSIAQVPLTGTSR
ncbi:hypothetical protein [Lentzea roselyniae]|uniref:hypothetical protein n=1 Tax=Lentzea roselyniae TaxID=531940 RepID=UPI0031FA4314